MGGIHLPTDPEQHGDVPQVADHPLVLASSFTEAGLQLLVGVSLLKANALTAGLPWVRHTLGARLNLPRDDGGVAAVLGLGGEALLDELLHGAVKQLPQLGSDLCGSFGLGHGVSPGYASSPTPSSDKAKGPSPATRYALCAWAVSSSW